MPVQEPCSLFLHPVHRVFSCHQLRQTRSRFFRQAFCASLPVFQIQEIDDERPKFRFQLWWTLIDSFLLAVFGEGAPKH